MLFFNSAGRVALCIGLLCIYAKPTSAVEPVNSKALIEVVDTVLAVHPKMQLAKARLEQAMAESKAKMQPLYNPTLALDYESNVENISTIGISQTIDWSNKQGANQSIALQGQLSAKAAFIRLRQSITADFLKTINRSQSTRNAAQLNQQQLDTLEEFVDIAKQRFKVGDISQVELDLALLTAGELRMSSAKIQSNNFSAQLSLDAFFNFERQSVPELSIKLIDLDSTKIELLLQNHPLLKQLSTASKMAKNEIKLAERQAKADPTISINAGKEGDENIVSLGFSMPLFVRNNFSAQVDAAIANSVAVEQDYLSAYRDVFVQVKSTKQRLQLTLSAYHRWIEQSYSGLQQRGALLQKLWKSGDLETTDYLIQLQQTLNTQIAATQLKAEVINAWIEFLVASGQIDQWLMLEKS